MLKFLLLLAFLFALALGFTWLKDTSGEVALTLGDAAYAVDLTTAVVGLIAAILLTMGLVWFIQELIYAPARLTRSWRKRKAEHGRAAISRGLIAVAAGDLRTAERAMLEASRRGPDRPLARLLQAQTAQLKGDKVAARQIFQEMTEDHDTRIAGLRGLYIEADREGEHEAAYQIAERAREEAPSAPWAASRPVAPPDRRP
jgi:HemY protein